jgi:septum formation protein
MDHFKPYKLAGDGVKDWIGMAAIKRIDGSFYNVMGYRFINFTGC